MNLITGENAQGKSNLLEAVVVLSTGSSTRAASDLDLVEFNHSVATVSGEFEGAGKSGQLQVHIGSPQRKQFFFNSQSLSFSRYLGNLPSVFFSAQHLNLILGHSKERRAFLDNLLSQVYPSYTHALREYRTALLQRNKLLKEHPRGQSNLLDSFDRALCKSGAVLMSKRHELVFEIAPLLGDVFCALHAKGKAGVNYLPSFEFDAKESLEEQFQTALHCSRDVEQARGFTVLGPHRDDLCLLKDGKLLSLFGSHGEQKTAVLALKFASVLYLKDKLSELPLFVVDDVLDAMDKAHTRAFMSFIKAAPRMQVFLAAPDFSAFSELEDENTLKLEIRDGCIGPSPCPLSGVQKQFT